jgi:hypothetical protein
MILIMTSMLPPVSGIGRGRCRNEQGYCHRGNGSPEGHLSPPEQIAPPYCPKRESRSREPTRTPASGERTTARLVSSSSLMPRNSRLPCRSGSGFSPEAGQKRRRGMTFPGAPVLGVSAEGGCARLQTGVAASGISIAASTISGHRCPRRDSRVVWIPLDPDLCPTPRPAHEGFSLAGRRSAEFTAGASPPLGRKFRDPPRPLFRRMSSAHIRAIDIGKPPSYASIQTKMCQMA